MLEPIQRASVFLLFSLRPETLLKSSSKLSAEASASLEPSKISVVIVCILANFNFVIVNRDAFYVNVISNCLG